MADNPFMQYVGNGAPAASAPNAPSNNPFMQYVGSPATHSAAGDKYHARAAQYLNDLDAQGKTSTGGALNTFLHGATAGLGNRAVAGLHAGIGHMMDAGDEMPFTERLAYENALEDEKYRRAAAGSGGTIGEVAGAIVNPANKLMAGGLTSGMLGGAALGATQQLADTRDLNKAAAGAGLGAAGGAVGNLAGRAIGAGLDKLAVRNSAPSLADIQAAAKRYEDDFVNSGVYYKPEAMQDLQRTVQDTLDAGRYSSTNHPGIAGGPVLPALQKAADNVPRDFDRTLGPKVPTPLTIRDLSRVVQREQGNPGLADYEQRLLSQAQGTLRDFPSSVNPSQVITGDSAAAGQAWKNANTEYTKAFKTEALRDALQAARDRAMTTGSGGNTDNAERQAIRRLLESRGDWTPDEQSAMRAIMGDGEDKAFRAATKMAPGGNGLMQSLSWLNAVKDPVTAVVPAFGSAAKKVADTERATALQNLDTLLRAGGQQSAIRQPGAVQQTVRQMAPRLAGPLAQLFNAALTPSPVRK